MEATGVNIGHATAKIFVVEDVIVGLLCDTYSHNSALFTISLYMRAILVKDTSCFGNCIRETPEKKHK